MRAGDPEEGGFVPIAGKSAFLPWDSEKDSKKVFHTIKSDAWNWRDFGSDRVPNSES